MSNPPEPKSGYTVGSTQTALFLSLHYMGFQNAALTFNMPEPNLSWSSKCTSKTEPFSAIDLIDATFPNLNEEVFASNL